LRGISDRRVSLMRSLFWRIFLSFWATQAAVLALAVFVAYLGIGFGDPQSLEQIRQELPSMGHAAVEAWEPGGPSALNEELEHLANTNGLRLWLLDSRQQQLSSMLPAASLHGTFTRPGSQHVARSSTARIVTEPVAGARDNYLLVAELRPTRLEHIPV